MNLAYNGAELALIREAAARDGMAPTAWAARAALAVAQEKIIPVSADATDVLQEHIRSRAQLRRIGNNLNQIAHVLNADGTVTGDQLKAVLQRVDQAVQHLDAATLQVMRERRRRP